MTEAVVPTPQEVSTGTPFKKSSGHPRTPIGKKIYDSPHKDFVATLLLTDKGLEETRRQLKKLGFPVNAITLKGFYENYVLTLEQSVKDELIRLAKEKQKVEETKVIKEVVHYRLSVVESTVLLLQDCERLAARVREGIDSQDKPSPYHLDSLGRYYDRIKFLREYLSRLQKDSEIEIEREKAIEAIADIALDYIKDDEEKSKEFIDRVTEFKKRLDLIASTNIL